MSIRVLIADDHALVRAALRVLVSSFPGVEVVGEASHGREAVDAANELRPDIVLMDISMPELNGLCATERITRHLPGTRVIILSMLGNETYVEQSLMYGAFGYVLKDAEAVELRLAINAVARGDTYLSPAVARHAAALARRGAVKRDDLTLRQREILQLVVEGRTTKEIARKFGLSVRTVDTHRTQIMQRLQIHDMAGLVRYAIKIGLIQADR